MNGGGSSTLAFDLNGNLTSDGTNSYAWDAENRLIRITYAGTNNLSELMYDGLNQNVKIVETTSGSVTSTKQFTWELDERQEERDSTGTLVKQFHLLGQRVSGTNYYFSLDELGSIREMTDNSGSTQAQYAFDTYGRAYAINESSSSDHQFAGYYMHSRSKINLTRTRGYRSVDGRWLNRDVIGEFVFGAKSVNLYAYVDNSPIGFEDPLGLGKLINRPGGDGVSRPTGGRSPSGGNFPWPPSERDICRATCLAWWAGIMSIAVAMSFVNAGAGMGLGGVATWWLIECCLPNCDNPRRPPGGGLPQLPGPEGGQQPLLLPPPSNDQRFLPWPAPFPTPMPIPIPI